MLRQGSFEDMLPYVELESIFPEVSMTGLFFPVGEPSHGSLYFHPSLQWRMAERYHVTELEGRLPPAAVALVQEASLQGCGLTLLFQALPIPQAPPGAV